jgi:hypothetical protein
MRKWIAAGFTLLAAGLMWLADVIWPRDLRDKQVIVVPPSAEDCAKYIKQRGN